MQNDEAASTSLLSFQVTSLGGCAFRSMMWPLLTHLFLFEITFRNYLQTIGESVIVQRWFQGRTSQEHIQ